MKRIALLFCLILLMGMMAVPVQGYTPAEQILIDSCRYDRPGALGEYKMTPEALDKMFYKLIDSGALPWYTTTKYSYTYDQTNSYVIQFTPVNLSKEYDREL